MGVSSPGLWGGPSALVRGACLSVSVPRLPGGPGCGSPSWAAGRPAPVLAPRTEGGRAAPRVSPGAHEGSPDLDRLVTRWCPHGMPPDCSLPLG